MNAQLTLGLGLLLFWNLADCQAVVQDAANPAPQASVTVMKLAPLKYPPLARQARITGDVSVDLEIRPDGSVASAKLLSGHPMLAPVAVQNARESTFICQQCTETTAYQLTYTFDVYDDGFCTEIAKDVPARSPKCLYLWKCGSVRTYSRPNVPHREQEIAESAGHVKIRASEACVETDASNK